MKKQFKTESQKVLDIMINSIYTHKEIFLREYISNASDAMDKLFLKKLEDDSLTFEKDDLQIEVSVNKKLGLIKIKDYGIGMSKEELEQNLGTIAHSDSQILKQQLENPVKDVDIIGQFGVGFYSGFMIAKEIRVLSKTAHSESAYGFFSDGQDGYKIEKVEKSDRGTEILLFVKDGKEFKEFLEEETLKSLIRKYSDYIRYPIKMPNKDGELETINSMIPIWKKSKADQTQEALDSFYQTHFNDYLPPLHTINMKVEGNLSFNALLYIPSHVPFNYFSADHKKGLELYSSSVFIEKEVDSLLPEGFGFVKGIVDSADLNLNISRETLQNDAQLSAIAKRIQKKIKSELTLLLKNNREKYEQFYEQFGVTLKYGAYTNFGINKADYEDLLLFTSSQEDKLVTLDEYKASMKEDQKEIYYVSAPTISKARQLPVFETYEEKGYSVLILLSEIDEFAIKTLNQYKEIPFKSINQGDFTEDESDKQKLETLTKENDSLLDKIKTALGKKVTEVRLTNRLKSYPVVLVASEGISFEMEKVLANSPDANQHVKAQRILEINPNHALFEKMSQLSDEEVEEYSQLLFDQACLIEGLPIEDIQQFSNLLSKLMLK